MAWLDCHCRSRENYLIRITILYPRRQSTLCQLDRAPAGDANRSSHPGGCERNPAYSSAAPNSQTICQFHIESGSSATLYSPLLPRRVWLHAILQDRLHKCDFCRKRRKTWDLLKASTRVHDVLDEHFVKGTYEYYGGETSGDPLSPPSTCCEACAIFLGIIAAARERIAHGEPVRLAISPTGPSHANLAIVTLAGRSETPLMPMLRNFVFAHRHD
jgi:hypothetical protein